MAFTRPTTTRLDDTNEIVMTGFADDVLYPNPTPPPPPPSGGNTLLFDQANSEYLNMASDLALSGAFSIEITAQSLVQTGTYIPLIANSSTSNRLLLSGASSLVALNINGEALVTKAITVDVALKHTYKLYRDASNDIYFQVDAEAPIFMKNSAANFTIRQIGKASSSFKITGIIHDFKINGEVYDLSEGTGNTLSSNSGNGAVWTINSTAGLTHINEVMWTVAPPETASIQVINKGVGGNNAADMDARFDADVNPHDPDCVFITPGTNDSVNSTNTLTPAVFKTKLLSMVNKTIALGATPIVWNIPPVIDSYKKADHDYTPIYGDESTYDINDKIELLREKVYEVVSETGALLLDVKALFVANGDPKLTADSYLINEANSGVNATDGVHFRPTGRQVVADAAALLCTGKTKIVWIGDSNIAQGGADSICIKLSLILNS